MRRQSSILRHVIVKCRGQPIRLRSIAGAGAAQRHVSSSTRAHVVAPRREMVAPRAARAAWRQFESLMTRRLTTLAVPQVSASGNKSDLSIKKLMACNRGEISIRISRAGSELGLRTVGVFSFEDRYSPHRFKADETYMIGEGLSPVAAYLNIDEIVELCKERGVDAVHPGYGFLSENAEFADKLASAGIKFVGPPGDVIRMFGDKTAARAAAIKHDVPVVPGTEGPVATAEQAVAEAERIGLPLIIKAAHGGGGRGMRVVKEMKDVAAEFATASSEAKAAFGNGTVFLERYIGRPRHIEVQILADSTGEVVHLYERDCSVQRRHQKVIETAPAEQLDPALRQRMLTDAVELCKKCGYENAGTVEFLVDTETGEHFFIEINPRVQVEHTVTEQVTGVDIVQSQVQIAAGKTLKELGLTQDKISTRGFAMQCRITTEDPVNNFAPDSGIISVYRSATGPGIRLDDGPGFAGALITPHYDSLLVKVTALSGDFAGAAAKMRRALSEFRIRGVMTNKDFLRNVLGHHAYLEKQGAVTTGFLTEHPEVVSTVSEALNRGEKLLRYLGNVAVNGPDPDLGASGPAPSPIEPVIPAHPLPRTEDPLTPKFKQQQVPLKHILDRDGPEAFARAVREHDGLLLTDTTWRDAHQSLLATRLRTKDILAAAPATKEALRNAYSIENWGGATFDVAMRFLRECPWDRLQQMREEVPDIPFQMLLRGANAVGYTAYPDNAVQAFCDQAVRSGMDVFRVFDSLNYMDNLRLGIDSVGAAGGVVEASICYTGDVTNPREGRYDLDYYLELARQLSEQNVHVLALKDMAGLLKPEAATLLVGALRREHPNLPIHVHTHDTAGTGVASMLAAARAGADAVDCAIDSMSGTTSQPSMGAIVNAVRGTELDSGVDPAHVAALDTYWDQVRGVYAPFEAGQLTGSSDVYEHEMPGGQMTNLMFQSKSLGLGDRWPAIKRAYADANDLLGDVVKVTPSSKVVGDLANFMVTNGLTAKDVREQASSLNFPTSVVEFFQGYLGVPPYGFPEPLRSEIVRGKSVPGGGEFFKARPGADLPPIDLESERKALEERYGNRMRPVDALSHVMYPQVFADYMEFRKNYGDLSPLPTRIFCAPMTEGEEISFEIEPGKTMFVKLKSVGAKPDDSGIVDVVFELNGEQRKIGVTDAAFARSGQAKVVRKADKGKKGELGAPMPGVVVAVQVAVGDEVKEGAPFVTLSAMKMETVVGAPSDGVVSELFVGTGDTVSPGDLLAVVGGGEA